MKSALSSLFAGLVFGAGLVLSGMINPAKVLNFLDLFGTWDPSLAFVMIGAIGISIPGFMFIRKKKIVLFASELKFPTRKDIDKKLIIGASLFGLGWGLIGFCPGPVVSSLLIGNEGSLLFTAMMVLGMVCGKYIRKRID
jgi:uncharacterized membrane protein YedE/YeeE